MNAKNRAALTLALAAIGAVSACSKSPDSQAHDDHSGHGHTSADGKVVRDDVYEGVLGEIAGLPVAGDPSTELRIHHEHIPGFKTKEGVVNVSSDGVPGMKSMTMPFPPAKSLDLSGLSVGDPVRFTFVVHWGGQRAWEVTKIEKLDAGTAIDFGNKDVAPVTDDASHDDADAEDHSGHDHP